MSRFASALYRISPEQSPRIRYTLWSRWFEKPRVPLKHVCHSYMIRSLLPQFPSKSLTVISSSQFWNSGLVREVVSYVGLRQKKNRRTNEIVRFFITVKKKMLGYETRLWKYKFAYLNQEDFFVRLTKRPDKNYCYDF